MTITPRSTNYEGLNNLKSDKTSLESARERLDKIKTVGLKALAENDIRTKMAKLRENYNPNTLVQITKNGKVVREELIPTQTFEQYQRWTKQNFDAQRPRSPVDQYDKSSPVQIYTSERKFMKHVSSGNFAHVDDLKLQQNDAQNNVFSFSPKRLSRSELRNKELEQLDDAFDGGDISDSDEDLFCMDDV